MAMSYHMQMNVEGCLRNWSDRRNRGVFFHDDGREMTPQEAKVELQAMLAKGHRFLPMSKQPCEGWTYENGCPGHPTEGIQ